MKIVSTFPTNFTPWDGLSGNADRANRSADKEPDFHDWDKGTSEAIGTQTVAVDHEDRITAVEEGPFADVSDSYGTVGASLAAGEIASGGPVVHSTVLTLDELSVTMTEDTTAFGTHVVYTFPAGNILILGATTDLAISRVGTELTATAAVVGSLGSAAATQGATLTSTEADIVPSTAATLSGGAGNFDGESNALVVINGTSSAGSVKLNFACADTEIDDDNDALLVTGTIRLFWINLGDN